MKLQTIINRRPRYKGYHIFDIDASNFLSASQVKGMVESYANQTNEMCERYGDEPLFLTLDEKWELFKTDFLEESDFLLIEIPEHIGFGIYIPEPKEYIEQLKIALEYRKKASEKFIEKTKEVEEK